MQRYMILKTIKEYLINLYLENHRAKKAALSEEKDPFLDHTYMHFFLLLSCL